MPSSSSVCQQEDDQEQELEQELELEQEQEQFPSLTPPSSSASDVDDSGSSTISFSPSKGKDNEHPRQLLVIDTDVSTDSVLAILLALTNRDCDVLAITIEKNRWGREEASENMLRILDFIEKCEIPVCSGSDLGCYTFMPCRRFEDESIVRVFPGHILPPTQHREDKEDAFEALNRLAEDYRGDVTLVCLGQLTNVALASRYGRRFCENLKHLYISGGEKRVLEGGNSHANFYADTLSACHVLEDFTCPITVVTWEASEAHHLPWTWYHEWISDEDEVSFFLDVCTRRYREVVSRMTDAAERAKRWPGFRSISLLTMTSMLRPSVVTRRETRSVSVVPRDPRTRGSLVPYQGGAPNCEFAVGFDMEQVRHVWEVMATSVF